MNSKLNNTSTCNTSTCNTPTCRGTRASVVKQRHESTHTHRTAGVAKDRTQKQKRKRDIQSREQRQTTDTRNGDGIGKCNSNVNGPTAQNIVMQILRAATKHKRIKEGRQRHSHTQLAFVCLTHTTQRKSRVRAAADADTKLYTHIRVYV